ncbi:MAG: anthranilate synthase component I [Candidatus Fonsibacter sp.]
MHISSYTEFEKLFKNQNFSQVYSILNNANLSYLENIINIVSKKKNSFIFESIEKIKFRGRFTIFGFNSDQTVDFNKDVEIYNKQIKSILKKNKLFFLKKIINKFRYKTSKHLPSMSSIMVGYFGYDIIRYYEKIPNSCSEDITIPDLRLFRPNFIIIYDNVTNKLFFIKNFYFKPQKLKNTFKKSINEINTLINQVSRFKTKIKIPAKNKTISIKSNVSKKSFINSIIKAKKLIKDGEIFQVVLSQRFETELNKKPIDFYKKLRELNPSPFMYYFNFKDFNIAGSSPEILVRVKNKKVVIRPIAGTRPRGKNLLQDKKNAKELLNDKKEISEHLMLLDLGRNDVGKVSTIGSVKVTEKFKIEKYSHVMHIVSNVEGKHNKKYSLIDTLLSGFPAGTVSGAPKIRAMEIIDQLELAKRKLYAGGIGYFTANGEMDTCIALRTALIKNKKIYIQSGAGIVADSIPTKEYQETVNKAKALLESAR